jgi:membrane protein implicated in regulation of membrane protease activity
LNVSGQKAIRSKTVKRHLDGILNHESKEVKENNGVIKSIFIAYFILLLHILLLAGLGVLILFFRGIVNYMLWVFLAGTGIIIFSAYRFYRKMKKEGKTLRGNDEFSLIQRQRGGNQPSGRSCIFKSRQTPVFAP